MSRSPSSDRIFLRPQYSIFYRRTRRLRWQNEPRADYAALFLLEGSAEYETTSGSGELRESSALLLDPGERGAVHGREAASLSFTLAPSYMLDGALRMRLVGPGASVQFRAHLVERDEHLSRLAANLADELRQEEAGQEVVIAALMEQLLVHLLRHHTNMRRSAELELSRVGLVDRRIRRAVELMHAHLDRDLPLEEIAAAAHLSPFHFARLFKKLTGASPHAYLATLRTAQAQTLLAQTDLSITEVSARVGYASSSHFTKAFRQTTGLTPRAFRSAIVRG